MDSVVIDTDVLSYLFKSDTRGELYQPLIDGRLGVISFMTLAELNFWANFRNWGIERRAQLGAFLQPFTVINSDFQLSLMWAEIRNQVMRDGNHIDTADCWIAATARLYAIPLITHNRSHFIQVKGLTTLPE